MIARYRSLPHPIATPAVVAVIVLSLLLPFLVGAGNLFFWTTVLIAIMFASSVNLLFGVADVPSFGQAAFFGAGGYAVALLAPHNWPAPLALVAAVVVAGAVAAGTSILTWRTTGLAFAMLTLAVAQALYTLTVKTNSLGGYNGLPGIVAPDLAGWHLGAPRSFWYFTLACVAVGLAVLWQVGRSPFGHTVRAIRENAVRATYLGVNIRAYRAAAFTIAGAMAGLAGGLSVYANQIATANMLYWTQSALPIIMLLLGGRYHFWGPALGAVVLTWLVNDLSQRTTAYFFYIGLLLMVVLLLFPEGILGLPEAVRRWVRWWRGRVPRVPGDERVGIEA
ncbi:MAG: branched-chain amino acid ABC transporter permease [Jatrophihabitans sp.]|nr:MAG: branched-chain amino acid ABC transporter permease [Jatrophihabitans sp.]